MELKARRIALYAFNGADISFRVSHYLSATYILHIYLQPDYNQRYSLDASGRWPFPHQLL